MRLFIRSGVRVAAVGVLAIAALAVALLDPFGFSGGRSTAEAFTLSGPAYPAAGQTLTLTNEDVQLDFISQSAGFNNEFGRALPGPAQTYFFCHNAPAGLISGGRYAGPLELRFYLTTPAQGVPSVPQTFYTGPAANNPDNFPHARMQQLNATTVRLEWEDLINGGDQDYNDCVIDIIITPLASLTICKNVVLDDGGLTEWDFTIDGPDALSDRAVNDLADNECQTESTLSAGNYAISEAAQAGYTTSIDCGVKGNSASTNINILLLSGDDVTCNVTNTSTASIQICKDVVPNNASLWNFTLTGPNAANSGVANGLGDNACQTFQNRMPGSYTVSETTQPGYTTAVSCGVKGNGGSSHNFTLNAGEAVTCTFTNTALGTITIIKDSVPNDPQDFTFSGSCFAPFTLDDDGVAANPLSSSFSAQRLAGSCTVVEDGPTAGWQLDSIVCQDPDAGTTVNLGTRTATIDLDPGETVTCTFTNEKLAEITVCKDVVPDDSSLWDFQLTGPVVANIDDLADGACDTVSDVVPGPYILSETFQTGYQPSVDCGPDGSSPGNSINLNVAPGAVISCTFTNTFTPGPPVVGGIAGVIDSSGGNSGLPLTWLAAAIAALLLAVSAAGLTVFSRKARRD